jgi:hypothetical protein
MKKNKHYKYYEMPYGREGKTDIFCLTRFGVKKIKDKGYKLIEINYEDLTEEQKKEIRFY